MTRFTDRRGKMLAGEWPMREEATTTTLNRNARQIGFDLPCYRCGYNVRGLDAESRCPECNTPIKIALDEHAATQARFGPPMTEADPRWRQQLRESMIVGLTTFALILLIAIAPGWLFTWRSEQRKVALGIACSIWVLSCFGAWKLGANEPGAAPRIQRNGYWLRGLTVAYLSLPYLSGLAPRYNAGWTFIIPALAFMIGGIIASHLFFMRLRLVSARLRCTALAVVLTLLAGVVPFVMFFELFVPSFSHSEDSLTSMLGLPTVLFASYDPVRHLVRDINYGRLDLINFVGVMVALASAGSLFRILTLLRRVEKSRTVTPADASENTPASSQT